MKEMPEFGGEFGGGDERDIPLKFTETPEVEVPIEHKESDEEHSREEEKDV